ncbi:MAG TPA: hypothetical protein VFR97_15935 [Capillimicrobium sp.]|nr:hypothetical protein [Capillimicrobium sp.]
MAELTPLDEKLAEVLGLAQAAADVTGKVAKLAEDDETRSLLERMGEEAKETAQRAEQVADGREGRKTAIHDKARETKQELSEMAKTYLEGSDTDALDGFEFLVMAEAGEAGHVEVLEKINEHERDAQVDDLIRFAKPIQERHVAQVRETTLALAAKEAEES